MAVAEAVMVVAILVAPVVLGFAAGATGRPWWWAAAACVVLFVGAAILPEPEAGEPRVAVGDLGFLAVVSAFIVGLAWVASRAGRRLAARRV